MIKFLTDSIENGLNVTFETVESIVTFDEENYLADHRLQNL